MIAVDTNLLVYAHRAVTKEHVPARRAIERAAGDPRGWGIALPSVAGFWSVVTDPAASGRPSRPAEAAAFLRALVRDGGAGIWSLLPGFADRLSAHAERAGLAGTRIFDLQIALIAAEAGATEIWSHDRRFRSVPGLAVYDPIA